MHQAMNGTRGGAAAIAHFDGQRQTLDFAGIGNIGASLIASEGSRGLASHPGIVGVRFRKAHVFDYPLGEARLLVLYSDGLQTRWNLRDKSEEHTSELQSLMRISYAVFCLKKKNRL